MRKMMFRAWDKKKKIWIPGAYGFHILGESMLIGGLFQDYRIEDLNDIVIMQWTGLFDKQGKEIYEGDILLNDDNCDTLPGQKFAVKWLPGHFVAGGILGAGDHIGDDCEVIGNIHENPELLKD